ncbi:MAG: twin-arginine translocase subunit TatB [Candidatus Competibacteraceae bacterium]|nr:twin-arginine translocase subunit TatB [Candidatus Competibacteraceae bacterium]
MFDISFWELAMIGVVALIVVGPERMPGLARTAGLWLGKARRMLAEVKAEVDRELQLDELKQSLRQQGDLSGAKEITDQMKSLRDDIQAEFNDPDDLGPPPGWRPGMPTTPQLPEWNPPPDYDPHLPLDALPQASTPVLLQKPATTSASPPPGVAPPSPSPPPAAVDQSS